MQREAAPRLVRVADEMDGDAVLVTVLNGTVELLARVRLRGHRREDLLTRLAPVFFDEGARAPVFEAFLERIVPDAEVRAFLQRWFGYCLTGDTSEQVVVMLWGKGSNGKSTLLFCLGHVHVISVVHGLQPAGAWHRLDDNVWLAGNMIAQVLRH